MRASDKIKCKATNIHTYDTNSSAATQLKRQKMKKIKLKQNILSEKKIRTSKFIQHIENERAWFILPNEHTRIHAYTSISMSWSDKFECMFTIKWMECQAWVWYTAFSSICYKCEQFYLWILAKKILLFSMREIKTNGNRIESKGFGRNERLREEKKRYRQTESWKKHECYWIQTHDSKFIWTLNGFLLKKTVRFYHLLSLHDVLVFLSRLNIIYLATNKWIKPFH